MSVVLPNSACAGTVNVDSTRELCTSFLNPKHCKKEHTRTAVMCLPKSLESRIITIDGGEDGGKKLPNFRGIVLEEVYEETLKDRKKVKELKKEGRLVFVNLNTRELFFSETIKEIFSADLHKEHTGYLYVKRNGNHYLALGNDGKLAIKVLYAEAEGYNELIEDCSPNAKSSCIVM